MNNIYKLFLFITFLLIILPTTPGFARGGFGGGRGFEGPRGVQTPYERRGEAYPYGYERGYEQGYDSGGYGVPVYTQQQDPYYQQLEQQQLQQQQQQLQEEQIQLQREQMEQQRLRQEEMQLQQYRPYYQTPQNLPKR